MIAGAIIIIVIAASGVLMMRFRKRWLAKINIVFTNRITSLFAGWLPQHWPKVDIHGMVSEQIRLTVEAVHLVGRPTTSCRQNAQLGIIRGNSFRHYQFRKFKCHDQTILRDTQDRPMGGTGAGDGFQIDPAITATSIDHLPILF